MRGTLSLVVLIAAAALPRQILAADSPRPVAAVKPVDLSSPQSAAREFRRAFAKKNWRRGFRATTPESADAFLGVVLFVAKFSLAAKVGDTARLKELLEDHGLENVKLDGVPDLSKGIGGDFKSVEDKPALFGQLAEWLADATRRQKPGQSMDFSKQLKKTKFSNFTITGKKARSDSVTDGRKDPNGMFYKRVRGRWYVDLEEMFNRAFRGVPGKGVRKAGAKESRKLDGKDE